jgi:hypothetical protein
MVSGICLTPLVWSFSSSITYRIIITARQVHEHQLIPEKGGWWVLWFYIESGWMGYSVHLLPGVKPVCEV